MTAKDKKDVAGKALYLEFRMAQYTYQTVVVPLTVIADNSAIVPLTSIRRRISVWHPRRNWGFDRSQIKNFPRDAYGAFEKGSAEERNSDLQSLSSGFYSTQYDNLVRQGWELYKTPLVVEFTFEELETVASGKMPVALYRRIERVRKNQGWAEELFTPELATA